ncbi:hypothetical protein B9479_005686 [Cryptococcus floricola]|uniref:Pentacotripeptide-repeat region of PRORP domain-containing protein n=1 Tax=Cryptococcus floricola TaxID=2591691 RepID=A0A5D3AUB7_9TREE|nr:hypothetical protein B9479_005686 [Cryptococcus floricola]
MPFRARCNPAAILQRRNAALLLRPDSVRISSVVTPLVAPRHQVQQYRHSSSSSPLQSPFSSFFSRIRRADTPETASKEFTDALVSCDINALGTAYYTIGKAAQPAQWISEQQLLASMRALAEKTGKSPQGLRLLRRMYGDVSRRFGYSKESAYDEAMILGLIRAGAVKEAIDLAATLKKEAVDWRAMLQATLRSGGAVEYEHVARIVEPFQRQASLSHDDYRLLLRVLRTYPDQSNSSQLVALQKSMAARGIALDKSLEAVITSVYIALGDLEGSRNIIEKWSLLSTEEYELDMWDAIVSHHIATNDVPKLHEVVGKMRDAGIKIPQRALLVLATAYLDGYIDSKSRVGYRDAAAAIDEVGQLSGDLPGTEVWTGVIQHYLDKVDERDSLDVALQLFDESQGRGIPLTAELVRTMIVPLCSSRKGQYTEDALRIYDEYMTFALNSELEVETVRRRFAGVYEKLFYACARASPPPMASVIRLLDDMRTLSIDFTPSNLISWLVLLMRASPDHNAAFTLYSNFHSLNPAAIDEEGYNVILTNFLGLKWEGRGEAHAPPDLFVSIMKDMARAGYQPSSHALTSLLKTYGHTATRLRRSSRRPALSPEDPLSRLGSSISSIHTLIKLDPLLPPDIPLLTSLMDAYNRIGSTFEAFEVWDEIVQRRGREEERRGKEGVREIYKPAINVMLDTCGWSYQLAKARKSWSWARRFGLAFDKKHYEAWVECLCRCGSLSEAADVVLDQMGKEDGVPRADRDTLRLLCKFGRKERDKGKQVAVAEGVLNRVKEAYPGWWDELKQEGGGKGRKGQAGSQ